MVKKIEDLVYNGNVLNEHGNWVPIADLLKKERTFLDHLSKGEVLHEGLWVRMDMLGTNDVTTPPQKSVASEYHYHALSAAEPTQIIEASEETVSMSIATETVVTYVPDPSATSSPESDFPPETAVLLIEKVPHPKTSNDPHPFLVDGKTQVDMPIGNLLNEEQVQHQPEKNNAEFEETVMFNIQAIQAHIDKKKPRQKDK